MVEVDEMDDKFRKTCAMTSSKLVKHSSDQDRYSRNQSKQMEMSETRRDIYLSIDRQMLEREKIP